VEARRLVLLAAFLGVVAVGASAYGARGRIMEEWYLLLALRQSELHVGVLLGAICQDKRETARAEGDNDFWSFGFTPAAYALFQGASRSGVGETHVPEGPSAARDLQEQAPARMAGVRCRGALAGCWRERPQGGRGPEGCPAHSAVLRSWPGKSRQSVRVTRICTIANSTIEMRFIASRQAFLERLTQSPFCASVIGSEVLGMRLLPAFEAWLV
jgi:hypothetical protein